MEKNMWGGREKIKICGGVAQKKICRGVPWKKYASQKMEFFEPLWHPSPRKYFFFGPQLPYFFYGPTPCLSGSQME